MTALAEPAVRRSGSRATLVVAVLGFFVVTLDAVVVNVALPTIRHDFGGGISGLQWVVDGYTLMFAALLLSAGAVSDRIGARRAFSVGLVLFLIASLACGLAPNLTVLVLARLVQGAGAAIMMPSSMALIRQAFSVSAERVRAVSLWAMGGALASLCGPVLGGLLTQASWRLIFLINLPVGLVALVILRQVEASPARPAAIDWIGQVAAAIAMGGFTYAAIETGAAGVAARRVLVAFTLAVLALVVFVVSQARGRQPMVPLPLMRNETVRLSAVIGFAFMVGYYGMPFVFSLYFQQERGLSALRTGVLFLPMMLVGAALTPLAARITARAGYRRPIVSGLVLMAIGLVALALLPVSTPTGVLSLLMIPVGLAGPLVSPPIAALLLDSVHGQLAGTASGVFNTSRQVGGALAVAVFGGLLAGRSGFMAGLRVSLLLAAAVAGLAALTALRLRPRTRSSSEHSNQPKEMQHVR